MLTGQIADLAGVPRTHVYRHFDGKQALDIAVTRRVGVQILEGIRAGVSRGVTPQEIITGGLDAYLGWVEEHPNLYRFLAKNAFVVDAESQPGRNDAKAILAGELTGLLAGYLRALGPRRRARPSARSSAWSAWSTTPPCGGSGHPDMTRAELAELADPAGVAAGRGHPRRRRGRRRPGHPAARGGRVGSAGGQPRVEVRRVADARRWPVR